MPTVAAYAVEQVSAYVSLVLTIFILAPQVVLNCRRQSTSGLSSSMMVQFLIASLLPASFYAFREQPAGVTISWFAFGFMSVVVMCQIAYYRPEAMAADGLKQRRARFLAHFLLLLLASALLSVFCYFLFVVTAPSESFSWLPAVVGSSLPTVLTAIGYLSQIRLIIRNKSSAGLSAGFIALDVMAAITSLVSVAIAGIEAAVLIPILSVLLFQLTLATLYFVFPPREEQKGGQLEPAENSVVGMVELQQEEDEEEEEDDYDDELAAGASDDDDEEEGDTGALDAVEGAQHEHRLQIAQETEVTRDEEAVAKADLYSAVKAEEAAHEEEEKVQELEAADLEAEDEEDDNMDALSASDRRLSLTVSSSDDSQHYQSLSVTP
jgi:uncharacterized protein with PQ loop repeat